MTTDKPTEHELDLDTRPTVKAALDGRADLPENVRRLIRAAYALGHADGRAQQARDTAASLERLLDQWNPSPDRRNHA